MYWPTCTCTLPCVGLFRANNLRGFCLCTDLHVHVLYLVWVYLEPIISEGSVCVLTYMYLYFTLCGFVYWPTCTCTLPCAGLFRANNLRGFCLCTDLHVLVLYLVWVCVLTYMYLYFTLCGFVYWHTCTCTLPCAGLFRANNLRGFCLCTDLHVHVLYLVWVYLEPIISEGSVCVLTYMYLYFTLCGFI